MRLDRDLLCAQERFLLLKRMLHSDSVTIVVWRRVQWIVCVLHLVCHHSRCNGNVSRAIGLAFDVQIISTLLKARRF
jgi:hypothetical protein